MPLKPLTFSVKKICFLNASLVANSLDLSQIISVTSEMDILSLVLMSIVLISFPSFYCVKQPPPVAR